MAEENLDNILWLCLFTSEEKYGVVGIFSSEEEAMLNVPDDDEIQCWVCPLVMNVPVGTPEDKFAMMQDRIYPVYAFDVDIEEEEDPDEVDKPKLHIVK